MLSLVLLALGIGLAVLVFAGDGPVLGLASDDFARLLSLGVILTVIASGALFAARGRWTESVRNASIWIALFAAVIAVYALGPEIRSIGERMAAALLPGRAVSLAGTDGGQVLVARSGDRHFHVDATVNGRTIPFLVDTGASIVAIDRSVAEAVGIDVDGLRYSERIRTANGVALAASVRLEELRVGSIARRNVAAVVTQGDGIGTSLLGMSFLGTLSSFDFRGDRLILTD